MKKKTVRDNGKILSGICFALIIGFWCTATYGGLVSDLFLPSPTEVVKKIIEDESTYAALITKGSVQFLATAQDPNIKMYANGASSDFVLIMDASEGADGLVATGDIKSLDDLTDFFELVK